MATVADTDIEYGFIGDSHTAGFYEDNSGVPHVWSTNNYAEIFLNKNKFNGVVYAMPGSSNRLYVNWTRILLDRYPNIKDIFIQLTYPSRWLIGFDQFSKTCVDVDNFTVPFNSDNSNIRRLTDAQLANDTLQLLFKPAPEFWDDFSGFKYNDTEGLVEPNITETPYYQVKMFFELNTHLEKQDQLMWIKLIDSMCHERNVNVHFFKINQKVWYDYKPNYWGDIKGNFSNIDIDTFMSKKNIQSKKYLIDKEHYSKFYHELIAEKYIPHLLESKNGK